MAKRAEKGKSSEKLTKALDTIMGMSPPIAPVEGLPCPPDTEPDWEPSDGEMAEATPWPDGFAPMSDEEMDAELQRWMREDAERRANTPVSTAVQWFLPYYEASFSKFNANDSEVASMMRAATDWMAQQPPDTTFGSLLLKHGEPAGPYVSVMFSPHIEPSLGLFVAAFGDTERLLKCVEDGEGDAEDFLRWMKHHIQSYRWRMERTDENAVE